MYKVAVIGDRETVIGFKALGLTVCYAEDEQEAKDHLNRLAKENAAVIYITDDLAAKLSEEISKYERTPMPAIILIPGKDGSNGVALANVSKAVERAVGADILK